MSNIKTKTKIGILLSLTLVIIGLINVALGNLFGLLFLMFALQAILIIHAPEILHWVLGSVLGDMDKGSNTRRRSCVKCGRDIPFDANLCPYCGHNFS